MNELTDAEKADFEQITESTKHTKITKPLLVRNARREDGPEIWRLVKDAGSLDLNSIYCYLILCEHFSNTCLVAERDGELLGFVTAYLIPDNHTTLFIWQIGVQGSARGNGIAKKLLLNLINSNYCEKLKYIQATVSPSNKASLALFNSLALNLGTKMTTQEYFETSLFPDIQHEKENLITVGPL